MDKSILVKIKDLFLDILFPKFCVVCGKEENYLCEDCFGLIEIENRQYCPFCVRGKAEGNEKTCPDCKKPAYLASGKRTKERCLDGLFAATPYENFVVKKIIYEFKYEPYIKDYSKILAQIMIFHLILSEKINFLKDFYLISVPLSTAKLKRRRFNQSEEIARDLSLFLKTPVLSKVLIRTKNTLEQADLGKKEREENIREAFCCLKPELVNNKKIILVDDIFTTGSTMEECARILKENNAKEVWGMAAARG